MDEFQEIIHEFLIESNENLSQLDQDFVELEQRPDDNNLLSSIFRTIHTIKGTCGFLGFDTLESVTHRAENLLSQLRDGEKSLTPEMTTLLLDTVDVVKGILTQIEGNGTEGEDNYEPLRVRLQAACDGKLAGSQGTAGDAPIPASETTGLALEQAAASEQPEADSSDGEPAPAGGPSESSEVAGAEPTSSEAPPVPAAADAAATPASGLPAASASAPAPPDKSNSSAEKPGSKAGESNASRRSIADSTIRVDVDLLDKLMNQAGELVLARNQILQHAASQDDPLLTATSQRLNLITTELQAAVMKTRMQPIGLLWNKFPRVVRDLAHSVGKQIRLEMEGAETELDKTIIESIKDPLTHIVRNSCDHGIESPEERTARGKAPVGVLRMRAFHEGGQVYIEIIDDGNGLDPQKLKAKVIQKGLLTPDQLDRMNDRELMSLIFLPGFSTAEKVTNVSGRGVGMDVVKTNIEQIGGAVDLNSRLGHGTTLKIKIPLTLAIIPALVVSCRSDRFAIPQVSLLELVRLEGETAQAAIEWVHGSPVYRLRGKLLPLLYLNKILSYPDQDSSERDIVNIVVLQADERTFGLVVDGIHDTQEIVVKPLNNLLKGLDCYAGATVMGDGRVSLILDVFGVAQLGKVLSKDHEHTSASHEEQHDTAVEKQTVLLFRSGSHDRLAVPLSLVARLEEFPLDRIEKSRGGIVVQYRDGILPLVRLSEQLNFGEPPEQPQEASLQVVVFSDKERQIGIIVDQIVDILEDTLKACSSSELPGIVGSAVIAGRVTDFLDLQYLIDTFDKGWFREADSGKKEPARILVADGSSFARSILRNFLEGNGFRVLEAEDGQAALNLLAKEHVDVLLSSLDLPGIDAFEVLRRVREEPALARIPVVGMAQTADQTEPRTGSEHQFDDFQMKHDREGTLKSIQRLARALDEPELVLQETS